MTPYPPDRFGYTLVTPLGNTVSHSEAKRIAQLQADTDRLKAAGEPAPRREVAKSGLGQLRALKESLK